MSMPMLPRFRHHRACAISAAGAASAAAAALFLSYPVRRDEMDHHDIPSIAIDTGGTRATILNAYPRWNSSNYYSWRSSLNLTKCEATNARGVVTNASFASNNPETDYDEEEESSSNSSANNDDGRINYYYKKMNPNDIDRTSRMDSHAIFGALWGESLIERYNIYQRIDTNTTERDEKIIPIPSPRELAVVDLKVGKKLNGHRGITHGGIISLLFDEAMGWAYECLQQREQIDSSGMIIVTANLTVDFRAPLLEGSEAVIRVYHKETRGRKIYFDARLESKDGNILFAEATSLFVLARSEKLRSNE